MSPIVGKTRTPFHLEGVRAIAPCDNELDALIPADWLHDTGECVLLSPDFHMIRLAVPLAKIIVVRLIVEGFPNLTANSVRRIVEISEIISRVLDRKSVV